MDQENRADWMVAVQTALGQHNLSGAISILQQEHRLDDAEWMCMQGYCQYLLGEFEQAKTWWRQAAQGQPPVPSAARRLAEMETPAFQNWLKRYNDALHSMEKKDYSKALTMLQDLIEENDGFVKLFQLLGLCYLAVGDGNKAETAWRKGIEVDISNAALAAYLQSFQGLETPPPSNEIVEKEIHFRWLQKNGVKPLHLVAGTICLALLLQGGIAIHTIQDTSGGGSGLQNRIDILAGKMAEPELMETPLDSVMVKTAENRSAAEAIVDLEKKDQVQESFYYQKGYNAYLQADYAGAKQSLGTVVDMGTRSYLHREALYYLARTCYLCDDYRDAEKHYKDYLDKFPNTNYYDDSLFYLGCVYYHLGQLDKTKELFTALRDTHEVGSGYESTTVYNEIMGR